MPPETPFAARLAEIADVPDIERLMSAAISRLLPPFLDAAEVEASAAIMGLDRQLIDDGTYYLILDGTTLVGCGGWSARATLFGGDHSAGRNAQLLDPATDAARVRAMYTHPDHTRRGIGRLLLTLSEEAALERGFRQATLVATMAGLSLYRACGYREVEAFREMTPSGVAVPLVRMEKQLGP